MKVVPESQFPVTDEVVKSHTGKSFAEWFAILDERGGPKQGRREINNFLYGECKVDIWCCATLNIEYEAARGVLEKDGRPKGYPSAPPRPSMPRWRRSTRRGRPREALDRWFGAGSTAAVTDGGAFRNQDGDAGTFKRVRPNRDLRFTWEHPAHTRGGIVDVAFQDKGKGKTGLIVTHDRIQRAPRRTVCGRAGARRWTG